MVHALAHERIGADGEVIPAVMPMSRAQKACVYGYAVLFTPAYYLAEFLYERAGYRSMITLSFLFGLVLFCLLVADHKNSDVKGIGSAMVCGFYPTAILSTMLLINSLPDASALGLLLIFVISPVTDTAAFFVGSLVRGKNFAPPSAPTRPFRARWADLFSAAAQASCCTGCTRLPRGTSMRAFSPAGRVLPG